MWVSCGIVKLAITVLVNAVLVDMKLKTSQGNKTLYSEELITSRAEWSQL